MWNYTKKQGTITHTKKEYISHTKKSAMQQHKPYDTKSP